MAVQLNLFDLNLLRALDALLQEKSVTRAAERLHVTQQAMSGSLKRLREHFGDDLLIRVGLRLEPTPLGAALIGPVRDAMLQIALAVGVEPTFVAADSRRRFRVALSDYALASFLPLLVKRMLANAPGLGIEHHAMVATAFADLESGDLEMSVQPSYWRRSEEILPPGIRSMPLYHDDFACAVDATVHRFETLTRERYLTLPHAAVRVNGGGKTAVGVAWTKNGINPHVAVSTTSFVGALLMLPGTPMIATVQRRLIERLASALPIRLLECPVPIDPLQQELYWHERCDDDPAHRYLRDQFRLAGLAITAPGA